MKKSNLWNSVKMPNVPKSKFDLTHDVKLSFDMGELVPTMLMEVLPGDTAVIGCDALVRFAPLLAPVMHRFDVTTHYFFVPNRILFEDWEEFLVDENSGGASIAHPTVLLNDITYNAGPLMDYMGLPDPGPSNHAVNALPFAAYQAVYNEYYRDQNLSPEIDYQLLPGDNMANASNLLDLRFRAWEHDYFTSALPFAQKGQPVSIPVGGVNYNAAVNVNIPGGGISYWPDQNVNDIIVDRVQSGAIEQNALYAAVTTPIEATTIEDLRMAFRLQEFLEKNARGGTRYTELVRAHFGERSSDARLQRPEYITGMKSPIVVSEVLNTTGTEDSPQGSMAGHGAGVSSGKYGRYHAEEHGWIIGISSVMPLPSYQQGIPKHFLKEDKFSYAWPTFANIGEQAVLNKELYAQSATPNGEFGFVPRYSEYKYLPNRVSGDFRTTLDYWTMTRIFETEPALNQQFIELSQPDKRIFAVEGDEDSLWCVFLNKVTVVRALPKYGTPTF